MGQGILVASPYVIFFWKIVYCTLLTCATKYIIYKYDKTALNTLSLKTFFIFDECDKVKLTFFT